MGLCLSLPHPEVCVCGFCAGGAVAAPCSSSPCGLEIWELPGTKSLPQQPPDPPALPEPPKFPCLQPAQSLGKLIPLFVPWARLLLLLTFSLALPAGNTLSTTLQPAAERISKEIQAVKSHPSAPAVQPGIFTGRWKPNSKNKALDRDQEVLCGFSWDLRVSPPWEGI